MKYKIHAGALWINKWTAKPCAQTLKPMHIEIAFRLTTLQCASLFLFQLHTHTYPIHFVWNEHTYTHCSYAFHIIYASRCVCIWIYLNWCRKKRIAFGPEIYIIHWDYLTLEYDDDVTIVNDRPTDRPTECERSLDSIRIPIHSSHLRYLFV